MTGIAPEAVALAFVIGAIPFGLLVSQTFFRRDIRSEGSGNIGAANALRTLGRRGAIAVLVLDALKGALPVLAGRALGSDALAAAGAFAAVAGHCFSPFLRFRGGKGVATYLGATLALAPLGAGIFVLVWVALAAAFRIASIASLGATLATIPICWALRGTTGGVYAVAASALILAMHRANLDRLRAGTENRLSFRRS